MWGRMASGGRLVIGLCEFSPPLVARSAMLTGTIALYRFLTPSTHRCTVSTAPICVVNPL